MRAASGAGRVDTTIRKLLQSRQSMVFSSHLTFSRPHCSQIVPLGAAFLALALIVPLRAAPAPAPDEVRALWVVRTSLTSPASIRAMVASARAGGFNTLLVQVRGRGDAYYQSRVEPRADALAAQPASFDPLATVLTAAHAAGLHVHAWVNLNLVADAGNLPLSKRHLVFRHPEWLMVPRDLAGLLSRMSPKEPVFLARLASWTKAQSATVEGLYASPLSSRAADHAVDVVADLAARYAVDGIHLDYARYPGPAFDYSRAALDAFRDEVSKGLPRGERQALQRANRRDVFACVDRFPGRWQEFRHLRMTSLVRRVRAAVRARRPGALVSVAVVPDPETAFTGRMQDWPAWIGQGLIDVVCPMAYTSEPAVFREQIAGVRRAAPDRLVWAGIGAYRLTQDQTIRNISIARAAGADGVVLFSYDSLTSAPKGAETLSRLGRAAFGR